MILGCGYTGQFLAARLKAAGNRVIATTRNEPRRYTLEESLGVAGRVVDVGQRDAFEGLLPAGSIIVDSIPPDPERPPHAPNLVVAAAAARAKRIVLLSSTSVYGIGDGSWVDEDTPAEPTSPRGRLRLEAEEELLAAARAHVVEVVILRIAAIYGPGRGIHERLRHGAYRVPGDGSNWVSRVHVDDLVSTIIAAGTVAELPRTLYVVADDEPTQSRAHADRVAKVLGVPPPESMPAASLSADDAALVLSNRRIRNTRMKSELGVSLAYPTWRLA